MRSDGSLLWRRFASQVAERLRPWGRNTDPVGGAVFGQRGVGEEDLLPTEAHGASRARAAPAGPQTAGRSGSATASQDLVCRPAGYDAGGSSGSTEERGGRSDQPSTDLVSTAAAGPATQKKSRHAAERNSAANLRRRQEYLAQIGAIPPERLIFLDESGVTTSMTRLRARSVGGGRIGESAPAGRWKILTILGAMRVRGIVATMTIEEATDSDIFEAFVAQVLCHALQPGDVVVMDNLASHTVPPIRQLIEKAGAQLLYLPPYSPDLNPIEKAWSKLKQLLRTAKARSREALESAITDALPLITPENAKAWFRACGLVYSNS